MSVSAAPVLDIRGLSIVYRSPEGDVGAVRDVDLALHSGQVVGLAGESGCGKSTLAYGSVRLLRPPALITAGQVTYHGRRLGGQEGFDVLGASRAQLRALRWREVAIVFQSAMNALNPVLRVDAQLLDALLSSVQMTGEEAYARVTELIELVGIPRARLRSYAHELSGGMRQRVMIAMALAAEPEVVIMDEPTTGLDVVVQREILRELAALRESQNFAVLFITHDLSLLLEMADRVVIMYAGQVVESAATEQIRTVPAHPYTQGLLRSFPRLRGPRTRLTGIPGTPPDLRRPPSGCPFQPRCTFATDACASVPMRLEPAPGSASPDQLTACPLVTPDMLAVQVGKRSNGHAHGAAGPGGRELRVREESLPVLEAIGLGKEYRSGRRSTVTAAEDVSLALHQGRVVALVGESGSGKSTVAKLLAGQERRTAGRVLLDGREIDPAARRGFRVYKSEVQMVFQDPFASLNPLHTVRYHLERALAVHAERTGRGAGTAEVDELLGQVRLMPAAKFRAAYPHELSGGQRQRVSIARALAASPRVLLADEPVSMLDVSIRLEILDLIQDLRTRLNLAVLYITHDIASARYFADEILVMRAGRIVERGEAEAITQSPAHEYTQLLIASSPDPDSFRSEPAAQPPALAVPDREGGAPATT